MAADDFEKELNGSPKKSKDFWLFLIFVDIIALVFFGFLIYQSLSAKFNAPPAGKSSNVPVKESHAKNVAAQPQMQPEEITSAPEILNPSAALPVQQNLPPAPPPAAQIQTAPPPTQIQPAPNPQPAAQPQPKPVQKQQSVFIEPTKGRGRNVTFKYFGAAKSVSIVSGFTMTKPQALKKVDGVWQGSFVIYPGEYKYLFIVDGVKTLDPNAAESDGRSVVAIQ
ncbi:MAG: hypothetical protein LBI01_06715 [Elusimicrobium sp.]|jgi:hypothetical protein|nr:hypothetical protein [Elusimicrobium sp.]